MHVPEVNGKQNRKQCKLPGKHLKLKSSNPPLSFNRTKTNLRWHLTAESDIWSAACPSSSHQRREIWTASRCQFPTSTRMILITTVRCRCQSSCRNWIKSPLPPKGVRPKWGKAWLRKTLPNGSTGAVALRSPFFSSSPIASIGFLSGFERPTQSATTPVALGRWQSEPLLFFPDGRGRQLSTFALLASAIQQLSFPNRDNTVPPNQFFLS